MNPVRRARGELEAQVLHVLWGAGEGLTAKQIGERLPGAAPAPTTVLTALDRLVAKQHVVRDDRQRGITFRAARTEEQHVSQTMLDQLRTSSNREAALLHFVGNLADEDAELLRRSLRRD
ncbi:MAG: BlaI/MecI/CopY family transcriptional regulator [Aeromicrobium sp.]|uniref:BlaI/MecI/CopY family transcriptional regulator n=1 Tax=Aeromicrobium sp. TaxID=1871063 RepID=UPI0026240BB0|nr:BlaI/MecI/CopY family transcriptional regulator [Aeromicrobium sp.]MDF1703507.1 BlaI/MecI/CopY family transcriptional regulator [Aeromicrobium sp.]